MTSKDVEVTMPLSALKEFSRKDPIKELESNITKDE